MEDCLEEQLACHVAVSFRVISGGTTRGKPTVQLIKEPATAGVYILGLGLHQRVP